MRRLAGVASLAVLLVAVAACGPSKDEQLTTCIDEYGRGPRGAVERCLVDRFHWDEVEAVHADFAHNCRLDADCTAFMDSASKAGRDSTYRDCIANWDSLTSQYRSAGFACEAWAPKQEPQ